MTQAALETYGPIVEPPSKPGKIARLLADKRCYQYRRLAALVMLINLGVLAYGAMVAGWWSGRVPALGALANVIVINFTVAILIRQQYIINALFWLATRAPTAWPLQVRWALGKVYHFGGLHSGGTVCGTLWFLIYLVTLLATGGAGVSAATLGLAMALALLLSLMTLLAFTPIRARFHDLFERSHRFCGWAALALFFAHLIALTGDLNPNAPLGTALTQSLGFWLLLVITVSIIIPWLHLKRVPIEVVRPSDHVALVKFDYGDTPFAGSSNAISRSPLLEWHAFANIPTPGESGYRLAISRAGDWTGDFIDNPPSHVWVKGITTSGVARIEVLFKRVVYIATGSGIGPVLPHLLAKDVPTHLVWATRSPRQTYGNDLVDEILGASPDALIWDTDANGKPDLAELALKAVHQTGAEAVICISNPKLTWRVVEAVEMQGIPGFGAIWDS